MPHSFADMFSSTSPALHFIEGPQSGPTLLLLHGVARNATDWAPLLPALEKNWHLIVLDQRGHGQSERTAGAYQVIDYARDAAAFVRQHCATPVTVLGHSLGAMVALWLAAECGERIARVVLEDPPFHTMGRRIGETPYRAQFAGMQRVAARELDDLEALTDALGEIELPAQQDSARESPMSEQTVRIGDVRDRASLRHSAEFLRQVDPDVFSTLIAGKWLDGFDYEALWSRVACPVLLLQGDPTAGGALTDADLQLAREQLRDHQSVRFDGVGHQIHGMQPEQVIAALNRFSGIDG